MTKPILILLHGAIGSAAQLLPLAELLQDEFEVYAINFSGHGGKLIEQPFSMDLFANDVLEFMNENQIESAHIFGYSMGGYVALTLAKSNPERVSSIITLGTKFDWNPVSSIRESKMLNPDAIEEKVPKFASRLKDLHTESKWKIVLHETAKMMIHLGNGHRLLDVELKDIKTRCTIGLGSEDTMVTKEETTNVAKTLPYSKFVELKDVQHPIDLIDPKIIANYIKEYIG